MKKQKSLAKNAVYNFLYTGVNTLFPLLTAPYVSRILGAENLGEVDFARSFVAWFLILSAFGTTQYGIREIAKVQGDKRKIGEVFSEIFTINALMSIISLIGYLVIILNNRQFTDQLPLFFIMSFSIALNVFNIDWFYQGIEEYSYITVRNAIIKLISLFAIFLFIKNEGDYIIYGIISVLGTSISGIFNLIHSKKYVRFSFKNINIFKNYRPLLVFFLISFVISIYTNLDLTLLGFIAGTESVAFLSRSKIITSISVSISNSISTVALPRASYYLSKDRKKYERLIEMIPNCILLLTLPITLGVFLLSSNIMFIIGGQEFLYATVILQIISPIIVFSSLSSFLHAQILVPNGYEKIGLWSSVFTSVVSLILNFILIPKYNVIGAAITLFIAEFIAVGSRYVIVKKLGYHSVTFFNRSTASYIISAFVMSIVVMFIQSVITNLFISFFISVILGAIIYFAILFLMKEKVTTMFLYNVHQKIINSLN